MSSCSVENQNPNNHSPLNNWSNLWQKHKKVLDHVVHTTKRRLSLSGKPIPPTPPRPRPSLPPRPDDMFTIVSPVTEPSNDKVLAFDFPQIDSDEDFTSLISDEIFFQILSKIPEKSQRNSNFLVSKRWLNLQGHLVRSLQLCDWNFLISGRMFSRFPNLIHVDLLHGSVVSNNSMRNSGILVSREFGSFLTDSGVEFLSQSNFVPVDEIDFGLKVLASVYPNLRRLVVANCSEMGLLTLAEECTTMQELVLHFCNDQVLRGIAAFKNLQILKLIAVVDGFYSSLVSDIGLTILAQGCKRLVKLELRGCEGSYDGIRAIGQCCQMLEELTFCDHRMDDGWLSALCYCENLKTLRFISCKTIDQSPGLDEHLGFCPMLERLHLGRCQLRDKQCLKALFLVCQAAREIVFKNCWGLSDGMFSNANLCRKVKFLSLEGCSRLTTEGLESAVLSWKELESLKVISCKKVKDDEVTPALSTLFPVLKELTWRPDSRSLLSTNLLGSGMGRRGGKFFKKLQI